MQEKLENIYPFLKNFEGEKILKIKAMSRFPHKKVAQNWTNEGTLK